MVKNIKVKLVPMVHIGEERYYKEVESKLVESGHILFEGIKLHKGQLRIKNREILAKRLGLVTQSKFNLKQFQDKLVHADYDANTAKRKWNELSFVDRIKSNVFLPIYMYFQDRTLSRSKFVKYFMKSNADIDLTEGPMFDKKETLKKYFHYERDRIIFEKFDNTINENNSEDKLIAIVYGAGHMRSIFKHLSNKYEYKVVSGEFINVFET